jgi:malic enzyme
MTEVLANAPYEDVRLIVVTDNERILGLGDQGAGGMGIPIGKLSIYCAAAGIHPAQTLPISLDVGTDNQELLADDLYIGWRQPRLRGEAYDAVVEEFVRAVKLRFPKALLQWEDFKQWNALRLLDRYRNELPSFNDDIQGTAAVAVAGVMAAARAAGRPLAEERLVIAGAGAAGVGIARLFRRTLEREGVAPAMLETAIAMLDSKGLVVEAQDEFRRELTWSREAAASRGLQAGSSLKQVVAAVRPTALIGVSGVPGLFDQQLVRALASQVERPAIFPLSNPTSASEATPADLLAWTDGRALVATGSPFAPVRVAERELRIGQGNNAFIFPGVGLAVLITEAREVSDGMFAAAADALAAQVTSEDLAAGSLFPRVAELRRVTAAVAEAVIHQTVAEGLARNPPDDPASAVAAAMWEPAYPAIDVV